MAKSSGGGGNGGRSGGGGSPADAGQPGDADIISNLFSGVSENLKRQPAKYSKEIEANNRQVDENIRKYNEKINKYSTKNMADALFGNR